MEDGKGGGAGGGEERREDFGEDAAGAGQVFDGVVHAGEFAGGAGVPSVHDNEGGAAGVELDGRRHPAATIGPGGPGKLAVEGGGATHGDKGRRGFVDTRIALRDTRSFSLAAMLLI